MEHWSDIKDELSEVEDAFRQARSALECATDCETQSDFLANIDDIIDSLGDAWKAVHLIKTQMQNHIASAASGENEEEP